MGPLPGRDSAYALVWLYVPKKYIAKEPREGGAEQAHMRGSPDKGRPAWNAKPSTHQPASKGSIAQKLATQLVPHGLKRDSPNELCVVSYSANVLRHRKETKKMRQHTACC